MLTVKKGRVKFLGAYEDVVKDVVCALYAGTDAFDINPEEFLLEVGNKFLELYRRRMFNEQKEEG